MAIDWNSVGIAAGAAFCGTLAVLFFGRPLLRAASEVRSLPRGVQGALAVLALVATLNAQKLRSGGGGPPDSPAAVTQEEVARGYRLVSETNETGHSFAMPSNAAYIGRLHEHGARSDFGMHRVDFGAWAFPCGANGVLRSWLWWFMDGRLQDAPRNPGFAASAGLGDTLAVQGESRLWLLEDGDERTVMWERFFAGGDTNRVVNAQISLRGDGGFTVRSNDLVRVYRRVNPDDWDDDGTPNDTDPNPLSYDGDNFGPHQELPEGANTNAYYWVDLVVAQANSLISFVGDGPSALPDPVFIAKAGATNRVILLIGKTYQVTSRMPITCIGWSSGEIEICYYSQTELYIRWPVEIDCETMRSVSSAFSMSVWPDWLGGGFTWTNGCCAVVSLGGWRYGFTCAENCICTGCGTEGYYGYEAYRLPACGGACGCSPHGDDDTGGEEEPPSVGVSVSFSKDAVIFESAYTNSYGQHVNGQSTMTRLTCLANGGVHGGHLVFSIAGVDKLLCVHGDQPPPVEMDLAPNETVAFNIDYLGKKSSAGKGDIMAVAMLTEYDTSIVHEDMASLTSIGVRTCVHSSWIPWTARKELGVGEKAIVIVEPCGDDLGLSIMGCEYLQEQWIYHAPFHGAVDYVSIACGEATLPIVFTVVEPESVVAVRCITNSTVGVGRAGGIVCEYDLHLLPTNVSFSAIETSELPQVSTNAWGYFAKPELAELLDHGAHGGGVWHGLLPRNLFFDTASISDIPGDWLDGGAFTYPIPRAWRPADVASITNELNHSHSYDQRMELDPDGTTRIIKFSYTVERATNGIMTVTRSEQ